MDLVPTCRPLPSDRFVLLASLSMAFSRRRANAALAGVVGVASAVLVLVACGSDDEEDGAAKKNLANSTAFVPAEAPTQPPIPPGAGPAPPAPDNGSSSGGSSGGSSGQMDAAPDTSPPADSGGSSDSGGD